MRVEGAAGSLQDAGEAEGVEEVAEREQGGGDGVGFAVTPSQVGESATGSIRSA